VEPRVDDVVGIIARGLIVLQQQGTVRSRYACNVPRIHKSVRAQRCGVAYQQLHRCLLGLALRAIEHRSLVVGEIHRVASPARGRSISLAWSMMIGEHAAVRGTAQVDSPGLGVGDRIPGCGSWSAATIRAPSTSAAGRLQQMEASRPVIAEMKRT